MKDFDPNTHKDFLRKRAMQILHSRNSGNDKQEVDSRKLIQELQVYQIELELQNEELKRAKESAEQAKVQAEKATQEYIELYDFAPSGYVSITSDYRILTINLAASLMLGKNRSVLKNTRFDQFVADESRLVLRQFMSEVFEGKGKISCEIKIKCKNDAITDVELSGILNENPQRCLISMVDISAYKKAEYYLKRAKEEAESEDLLKSAFIATMSHEIRTPLNSIIGFSGILLKEIAGPLNEEQKKQLGMLQSSGRHLLSLINEILDLSKIEAGQFTIYNENFNIIELIEDVVRLVEPFAQNKELSLNFIRPPDKIEIRSDKQRLHQVLLNIINNAVKFSNKGTSIKVTCFGGKDEIRIEITDQGIGIQQNDLEKIFNPFFQVEGSSPRNHEGTGLGLSVSKKIIELLHGSIRVESKFGTGSVFTISVPRRIKNKNE